MANSLKNRRISSVLNMSPKVDNSTKSNNMRNGDLDLDHKNQMRVRGVIL